MTTYLTPICVFDHGLTKNQKDRLVREVISSLPAGYVAISVNWPDYITTPDGEKIDNSEKNKFYVKYAKVL